MKQIVLLIALVVAAISCGEKKQKTIDISVTYSTTDNVGKHLYLVSDDNQKIDSVLLEQSNLLKFSVPALQYEAPYALTVVDADKRNTLFYAGTHDITIELKDVDFYDNIQLEVSDIQSEGEEQRAYVGYWDGMDDLDKVEQKLRVQWDSLKKADLLGNAELRDPLDSLFIKNSDDRLLYNETYLNDHKNAASLGLLNTSFRFKYRVNQLDSLAKLFPEKYHDFASYKQIQERIGIMKRLEIGAEAPDFSIPDVDGTPVSLSSFRGNYVLLDFWASWCGPCRKENPHVLAAYKKYKDKGFQVLGVSYDYPHMKKQWLEAIEKDGLPWTHVSNLSGWKDPTAKLYNISGIPSPFLIDPEGKIVEKGNALRNEGLDEVLHAIYSQK